MIDFPIKAEGGGADQSYLLYLLRHVTITPVLCIFF